MMHSVTPPAKRLQFERDNLNSKGFVNVSFTVFICSLMKKTFECIIDRAVGTCLQVAFAWVPTHLHWGDGRFYNHETFAFPLQ